MEATACALKLWPIESVLFDLSSAEERLTSEFLVTWITVPSTDDLLQEHGDCDL